MAICHTARFGKRPFRALLRPRRGKVRKFQRLETSGEAESKRDHPNKSFQLQKI